MEPIFESAAVRHNPNITATHVLLVGCGEYPHLAGAGFGSVQPLSAPQLSAKAMADWFLNGPDAMPSGMELPSDQAFCNPEAPLGSLVMLTSPALAYQAPFGGTFQTALPTRDNIKKAYIQWLSRLSDNPDSRGVFYFCGHGISNGTSQFLVADDFGEDADDPWSAVFHVSNTCQATIRKTSASLFFLLDACMEFQEGLLNEIDDPQALIPGKRNGPPKTTEWAVMRATTVNRIAYAPQGDVARFTSALLNALRGYCGHQRTNGLGFDVGVSDLREATADFLTLSQQTISGDRQKMGQTEGEGNWKIAMHVQNKRPLVLVEMDVQPEGYRPVARAFMEAAGQQRDIQPFATGPVHFVKPQGEWSYGTNAQNNEYAEQIYHQQFLTSAVHTCRFRIP
jgi:hypothetical protein